MQVALDASKMAKIPGARIAILQASWYREYVDKMVSKCRLLLKRSGAKNIEHHLLPGSLELPLAAQTLIRNAPADKPYDALICFGAVMKGETYHFELIMNEAGRGFTDVMLCENVPIIVEVIPITSVDQLKERSKNNSFNKGVEAAIAASQVIAWRRKTFGKKTQNTSSHRRRVHP
jgi:6,7-dimethyl-8-ribityllumazine synthase